MSEEDRSAIMAMLFESRSSGGMYALVSAVLKAHTEIRHLQRRVAELERKTEEGGGL
jgi:hypothetical protein